jgi:hypothetical protein
MTVIAQPIKMRTDISTEARLHHPDSSGTMPSAPRASREIFDVHNGRVGDLWKLQ